MRRSWARSAVVALWLASAALAGSAYATVWPSSHQRVADALLLGDTSERRGAAAKLTELPPKLARGLARKALRDGDVEVRLLAARAAAELGVRNAGDEVVSWLSDGDARLRAAACELIEASPTLASVQALARVLSDAQASVRRAAAAAMGSSGMTEAVSPLLGHLDDGSSAVRLEVVRALGRLGDERAVVPLVSKLQDQEVDVRREAARALGQLGDPRAVATLMLALQDASPQVQAQALDALGKLGASDATAAIAALFSSEGGAELGSVAAHGPVHDAALRALGRIGTPEAIKLLVDALEREGPVPLTASARAPARRAIGLAGKPAMKALANVLAGSPSPGLAAAAALALGERGDASATTAITRATQRGLVPLDVALQSLATLGDKRALSFVLEHLDVRDASLRQTVVATALALLDPEDRDGRAVDVVEKRVRDLRTPVGERVALVELLGRTGSPRALGLLLPMAKSKPSALRVAVVEAMGVLGSASPKVDEVLLEALEAPSERLRRAAATSLARVGKDEATRKLLHRLGVSAEQDRAAIGVALSGTLGRSSDPKLVPEVNEAMAVAASSSRDSLIEGLGRMPIDAAGALLDELRKRADADDRRKIAEALAGHASQQAALLELARDPDPTVRANAVWSLGRVGNAKAVAELTHRIGDVDVAVAGNATVALARVAKRGGAASPAAAPLCAALGDYRSYVRVGALTGLRLASLRCTDAGVVRRVLRSDRAWRARLAAARLLRSQLASDKPDGSTKRALWRCAVEDRDALVAERCARDASSGSGAHDVTVYVVPDGKTEPTARAPFALVLPDGTMRLGVADRRGALFERSAPGGRLELAVPAALAR